MWAMWMGHGGKIPSHIMHHTVDGQNPSNSVDMVSTSKYCILFQKNKNTQHTFESFNPSHQFFNPTNHPISFRIHIASTWRAFQNPSEVEPNRPRPKVICYFWKEVALDFRSSWVFCQKRWWIFFPRSVPVTVLLFFFFWGGGMGEMLYKGAAFD